MLKLIKTFVAFIDIDNKTAKCKSSQTFLIFLKFIFNGYKLGINKQK